MMRNWFCIFLFLVCERLTASDSIAVANPPECIEGLIKLAVADKLFPLTYGNKLKEPNRPYDSDQSVWQRYQVTVKLLLEELKKLPNPKSVGWPFLRGPVDILSAALKEQLSRAKKKPNIDISPVSSCMDGERTGAEESLFALAFSNLEKRLTAEAAITLAATKKGQTQTSSTVSTNPNPQKFKLNEIDPFNQSFPNPYQTSSRSNLEKTLSQALTSQQARWHIFKQNPSDDLQITITKNLWTDGFGPGFMGGYRVRSWSLSYDRLVAAQKIANDATKHETSENVEELFRYVYYVNLIHEQMAQLSGQKKAGKLFAVAIKNQIESMIQNPGNQVEPLFKFVPEKHLESVKSAYKEALSILQKAQGEIWAGPIFTNSSDATTTKILEPIIINQPESVQPNIEVGFTEGFLPPHENFVIEPAPSINRDNLYPGILYSWASHLQSAQAHLAAEFSDVQNILGRSEIPSNELITLLENPNSRNAENLRSHQIQIADALHTSNLKIHKLDGIFRNTKILMDRIQPAIVEISSLIEHLKEKHLQSPNDALSTLLYEAALKKKAALETTLRSTQDMQRISGVLYTPITDERDKLEYLQNLSSNPLLIGPPILK